MERRRRHGMLVFGYYLLELGVLSGTFFATYWLRQSTSGLWGMSLGPVRHYLWLWPVALAAWSALLWGFNTYLGYRSRSPLSHGFLVGVSSALGVLALFALLAILKQHDINRSFVGLLGVVSFLALFGTRVGGVAVLSHHAQKGYDRRFALVGGSLAESVPLAEALESMRGSLYQVRGIVSAESGPSKRWKILGRWEDIPALAALEPVDEVFLLPASGSIEEWRPLIEKCESMGITVHLRLTPFDRLISRLSIQRLGGADYLSFSTAPRSALGLAVKRILDCAAAGSMLALLSPLLLVVALLVKLTSRGPVVFRQERAGMSGRRFTLYKIRTMAEGAEKGLAALEGQNEMDGPVFKMKDDPRVTGLGRFLRRTSIDELPQLWNVLKGDMSLVGPRPLPVYEVEKFEPWQRRRMAMRPGITCLWQVAGRNAVSSFADWMRLDLEYVDRWSLGLDLKILASTIPAVLLGRGAY